MADYLSRLTLKGINEVLRWIELGAMGAVPTELTRDGSFSERLAISREVSARVFRDRYEFGMPLCELLQPLDAKAVSYDKGLWSWLAAFYFDQLCPPDHTGRRNLKREYAYVLADSRKYYRHIVRTPWFVVNRHGENCKFLLLSLREDSAPLSRQSGLLEELAARQFVISSPSLIEAARYLYADFRTGRPSRGAGAQGRGSARRLALVANQLTLTYDVQGMPVDQLISLLPEEFGAKWRQKLYASA